MIEVQKVHRKIEKHQPVYNRNNGGLQIHKNYLTQAIKKSLSISTGSDEISLMCKKDHFELILGFFLIKKKLVTELRNLHWVMYGKGR